MRRSLTVAAIGLAAAAFLAPAQPASAVCWPDLSAVGGPSCPNLCHPVAAALKPVTGDTVGCFE